MPPIGVVDEPRSGPASGQRHVQGAGDEPGIEPGGEAPAHDPPAPDIGDGGEVAEPRPGRQVRDVRNPQPVGPGRGEVALDEVGGRGRHPVGDGGGDEAPAADAGQGLLAHEPRDPLAAGVVAGLAQLGVDPGRAVGAPAPGIGLADPAGQLAVGEGVGGRAASAPGVVAARGDTKRAAQQPYRVGRLLLLDEAVHGHRVRSDS